ncbi:hypothetical protein GCM10025857_08600 [Alicyclobacillus contaminans]|nr:hypothetical protein GCM10025857_08600 [Alicyclobacillus contaminans]
MGDAAMGPAEVDRWGQGGTSYRVMYRGEEDMLRQFAEALHSSENRFFADGWLIWRTLRQGFATSGWRREWLEDASGKSYYHVELELTPPKEHVQAEWTVQIYIAHNEWNARRPLADWWTTPSRHWRVGREMLFAPDTWFLPQLLAAAAVWPELAEALARPGVSFVVLSPDDVYSFLTERLPALEELGIPVRYPDISTHPLSDIRIKVRVQRTHRRQQRTSSAVRERWFSAEQLVDFDWTVALGDVELPAETFEQMVARGTPFVQVGGSWKLIPMQAILKQLEQLRAGRGAKSLNAVQFTRAVLLAEGETEGAAVDVEFDQTATDARQVLRALLRAHTPVLLEPPADFAARCAPINGSVTRGWPISDPPAAALSWPMIWGWEKPFRCWRICCI